MAISSPANDLIASLKNKIRTITDFPQKGVLFYDITPLLSDAPLFEQTIRHFANTLRGLSFDAIVAPEARGFFLASPLAFLMQKALVPVRKKGKLPAPTFQVFYSLEYGDAILEIHQDALKKGQKVLIMDDVLATAGTAQAIQQLVTESGATISAYCFLMEILALKGKQHLPHNIPLHTLLSY